MPIEVRVRFGRWDEVLAAAEPAPYHPIARTLRHGARAVAYAARDQLEEARAEVRRFTAARARVAKEAFFGNNAAADVLAVAEHMMTGEVLLRAGDHERGLAALRDGVAREDRLRYDEPPDWILPVRHALGAALVRLNRLDEAEAVFRADLAKLPGNGWSLFGLAQVLERTGRHADAAKATTAFAGAWKNADVTLTSACFCQADAP
jgi:tetratricopeptide (TPR) repeat protein